MFDESAWTLFVGFWIAVLVIIGLFLGSLIGIPIYCNGYKKGQIDYQKGIIKYQIKEVTTDVIEREKKMIAINKKDKRIYEILDNNIILDSIDSKLHQKMVLYKDYFRDDINKLIKKKKEFNKEFVITKYKDLEECCPICINTEDKNYYISQYDKDYDEQYDFKINICKNCYEKIIERKLNLDKLEEYEAIELIRNAFYKKGLLHE